MRDMFLSTLGQALSQNTCVNQTIIEACAGTSYGHSVRQLSQMSSIHPNETTRLLQEARKFKSQRQIATSLGVTDKTVRRWEKGETIPNELYAPQLRALLGSQGRGSDELHEFTFIDLFAGIGGMRLAFEAEGGECVFTCEWNRFCQETYRANFNCKHAIAGDICAISDKSTIPDHDVLLAGFPCQPFSIAGVSKKNSLGKNHGFADEAQGTLFFEIVEVLRAKRPIAFLLENVKNLVSHDRGNTFRVIMNSLRNLGYTVGDGKREYRVVDAQHFVPQHRERTFIVGFRKQTGFSWCDLMLPHRTHGPKLSEILHPENGSEAPEPPYTSGPEAVVDSKYILTDHLWSYLKAYAAKHRAKGNGFGFGLVGRDGISRTLSARYYKDGSEILVDRGPRKNPRRLTPRECSRLMGFDSPDRRFLIPVSDTQAYKQFGNAVCPPVVQAIAQIMKPHVLALKSGQSALQQSLELMVS